MDDSGNGERKITTTSPAPLILGISIFGHDSSGTLLNGNSGDVLYALTEERFSNLKHDGEFPVAVISKIKEQILRESLGVVRYIACNLNDSISVSSIKSELINVVDVETAEYVFSELLRFLDNAQVLDPNYFPLNYISELLKHRGISLTTIKTIQDKISWYGNFVLRIRRLHKHLESLFPEAEVIPVDHHSAHAASAFYGSGFESAAVLTLDGQGELATSTLSIANGTHIKLLTQTNWPNSLGALYMALTWHLGFDGDDPRYLGFGDEFKVMGMSAYGKPTYSDIFRQLGSVNEQGQFEINFSNEYIELLPVEGCDGHAEPVFSKWFSEHLGPRKKKDEPFSQKHYDIASSGQYFIEQIGVDIAKNLKTKCPEESSICLAGGVALNGLMNMRILQDAGFSNVFIQPASGDDGTSLGAAWHVYHEHLHGKRCAGIDNVFFGLDYDSSSIQTELETYKLQFSQPKSIHVEVSRLLNEGKIVARYVGRGEFGPRALGHRSILANPTLSHTKDEVNSKIKHRESFRPFAPACLDHKVQEYFNIHTHSPYMLLICTAEQGVRLKVPAVIHEDNTARLQSVKETENPDLYQIISEFYRLSKVPMVLNTSFNVNGEAIVETPQDAIESFLFMGIDYLAIGPFLVSREDNLSHYLRPTRAEHIKARQVRYQEKYFSPERFLYPTSARIESQLSILKGQVDMYRNAAEERLSLIERLDLELKKLAPISSTKDKTNH